MVNVGNNHLKDVRSASIFGIVADNVKSVIGLNTKVNAMLNANK